MKGTILYTKYDENDRKSTVVKQTKYGTFERSVKLHPDDEDIKNDYDGYHFAEMKCDIAAYKVKAEYMRQRAIGVQHTYNVLLDSCDEDDPIMQKLWRQVQVAWWNFDSAFETYKILRDSYKSLVEVTLRQRREFRKRIAKRYNKN